MKPTVVVGTIFVDIKGFSFEPIDFQGRNPGTVQIVHGGVGRNVAETMALLGAPVRFVSSVTRGGVGDEVLQRLHRRQIETTGVAQAGAGGHGTFLAILQPDGVLACSLSHPPDFTAMKALWRERGRETLAGAGQAVVEVDLDPEMAELALTTCAHTEVPVVALPSNFSVIRARRDLLALAETFILNRHEAELLLGRPVPADPEGAARAARDLLALGPATVVVTLGEYGAAAATAGGDWAAVPAHPVHAVDVTGAGDAFVSGFSYARAAGAGLADALTCAARVAAWTVNSPESVCLDLRARIATDGWPGWQRLIPG